MKNEIILSFCVPTYNRAARLRDLVEKLLSYPKYDIEIVISDNKSTDNTLETLSKIDDPRLKVYPSDRLLSPVENWIRALSLGHGRYVFHLNDRDMVVSDEIPKLIQLLKVDTFSYIWCCYPWKKGQETQVFEKGISSLEQLSFAGYHPTGLVFNRDMIQSLGLQRFTDFDKVNVLPHNFLIFELSFLEKTAFYFGKVWKISERRFIKHNVSGFLDKRSAEKWFEPEVRRKQLVLQADYIMSCKRLNRINQRKLLSIALGKMLRAAVNEYYFYATDEIECSHYAMEVKRFSFLEMEMSMFRFYGDFIRYLKGKHILCANIIWKGIIQMLVVEYRLTKQRIRRALKFLSNDNS